MATIYPRKNKDGSCTWRLMFRRKGIKPFITGFSTEKEARLFAEKYEKVYCFDPDNFGYDRLKSIRVREFNRL